MPTYSAFPSMGPIIGFQTGPEDAFATPEERHGGPADPFHAYTGEIARPYSWQSQLTNYTGHTGPVGAENGLLSDERQLTGLPAGQIGKGATTDLTPYRTHAAPMTVVASGPLGSQHDAIQGQLIQSAEMHATDLGGSRKSTLSEQGMANQDHWLEIWDVSDEPGKYGAGEAYSSGTSLFGFGNNDRPVNPLRKRNRFGFDRGHHHRRFAAGTIPGNYMWMKPGGRPMIKTLAGPARPAIGKDSPFEGDDLGHTFGIQGAVLVEVPQEYTPPPGPQFASPVNFDEPAPTIALW